MALVATVTASSASAATIRVHYDTGWSNGLSVRGSANSLSWHVGQSALWTPGNIWVYETPESDGDFEFKPLLNDSHWSIGGNYTVPAGDSVVDIYPFFGSQGGSLVTIDDFYSTTLGNSRDIIIYLPPGYHENTLANYPVLYMHDGQNLFNSTTAFGGVEWQVDETIDSMVKSGEMREVIVVGLQSTYARLPEYTPTYDSSYGGGNGDAYLDFIETEVMLFVESNYRVRTGPENTYIGGSSLGGLISFYAGWTRSHVFGKAICMSSSFWWNNGELTEDVWNHTGLLPSVIFYIDAGGINDGATNTADMRDALFSVGYNFNINLYHWYNSLGQHNEASWAARFHVPMEHLLPF